MQTAAYYFPNYHQDIRNEEWHGAGWTEWELMKCARPRFAGHRQPRVPAWGYEDESDPTVMSRKIDAAADYGLNAFVFDWYWYDGPYLERALDEGFLKAPNRNRLSFALMWANHDWHDRHPTGYMGNFNAPTVFKWSTTPENIGEIWDYVVERYMIQPNYWRVDGKPYFSIYAVERFIRQMGGAEKASNVLNLLREKARAAGLPGVHLNAVWYDNLEEKPFSECATYYWNSLVGFDSYTSYNFAGVTQVWQKRFPVLSYDEAAGEYLEMAKRAFAKLTVPYYPVVTAGWDASPRTIQSDAFRKGPYPFMPVMDTDVDGFTRLLHNLREQMRDFPESRQIIFFNAWNEWTEGSYLEPDTFNGYRLLEAIRELGRAHGEAALGKTLHFENVKRKDFSAY